MASVQCGRFVARMGSRHWMAATGRSTIDGACRAVVREGRISQVKKSAKVRGRTRGFASGRLRNVGLDFSLLHFCQKKVGDCEPPAEKAGQA